MSKNIDDLEDIIKILIDLLHNENMSYHIIKRKIAEFHYCLICKQHFNRCKCSLERSRSRSPSPTSMDSNENVSSSEVDDSYSSSPDN
jgi:hypothetical protein